MLGWLARRFGWLPPGPMPGANTLAGYLALGRMPGFSGTLDQRLGLLAGVLASELSGCRWCVDRSEHDARRAGLPRESLADLRTYTTSPLFTPRERAALAFVEAIGTAPDWEGAVLERAHWYLTDQELAELAAIVAEHHCLESPNPNHV
jgi:AhpD family alkylhydroperoxidase